MLIENLPYVENALDTSSIAGSAGTSVVVDALSFGNSSTTVTRTNSRSKLLPNGGSLSIGRGWGKARGDSPLAEVTTTGSGDIVVGTTRSTPNIGSKPVDVANGVVVAIVLPS